MTADARALNVWRRVGYRLLPGDSFSYVLHLRPAEWPIMAAHTALGFALAVGLWPLLGGAHLRTLGWALVVWVVCLNGGTLAINSVFDRDEGDIGYLRAPPPPPAHLFAFSLALLILGQVLAFTLPPEFAAAYAICFAMSLAYSVPPLRFKAVAGVDWLINMWGFGALTPYAGWAASGRPLDPDHVRAGQRRPVERRQLRGRHHRLRDPGLPVERRHGFEQSRTRSAQPAQPLGLAHPAGGSARQDHRPVAPLVHATSSRRGTICSSDTLVPSRATLSVVIPALTVSE